MYNWILTIPIIVLISVLSLILVIGLREHKKEPNPTKPIPVQNKAVTEKQTPLNKVNDTSRIEELLKHQLEQSKRLYSMIRWFMFGFSLFLLNFFIIPASCHNN